MSGCPFAGYRKQVTEVGGGGLKPEVGGSDDTSRQSSFNLPDEEEEEEPENSPLNLKQLSRAIAVITDPPGANRSVVTLPFFSRLPPLQGAQEYCEDEEEKEEEEEEEKEEEEEEEEEKEEEDV
ncbi:hypothetical protein LSTR_LSTR003057 [Laodelphax striatellus]|uniref:Uncharacterized protein n=1 Tax=Laodelphax striatellus TaxID=195883 RepID=A0A482XXI9_LAOST|nr:hypothetical protein LSTR_LSTR003057 [Laodelphax striatellus]